MIHQAWLLLLVLLAGATTAALAEDSRLPDDLKDVEYKQFPPKKDSKTGFIVGGKNETALIRKLTHLAGRPIAELEADLRPEKENRTEHRSKLGFLGPDEKLLDVLAADNELVVGKMGLAHQDLARVLKVAASAGDRLEWY